MKHADLHLLVERLIGAAFGIVFQTLLHQGKRRLGKIGCGFRLIRQLIQPDVFLPLLFLIFLHLILGPNSATRKRPRHPRHFCQ